MAINPISLAFNSQSQWQALAEAEDKQLSIFIPYLFLMAIIPCAAWIYGTTAVGWQVIGQGDIIKLSMDSAITIAAVMYVCTIMAVYAIGYSMHWMAETYGSQASVKKGLALASLAATPFFLISIVGLYPLFWIDLSLMIVGCCWSIYLLYAGIPTVMKIPEERGFLFASAVLAVSLVILIALLGATAILWDMGALPVFVD